jgi:hypothetical protein
MLPKAPPNLSQATMLDLAKLPRQSAVISFTPSALMSGESETHPPYCDRIPTCWLLALLSLCC